jgi:hypothetical protein
VGFRIGQISERLRDAVDADRRGHERSGVDLAFRYQGRECANSSGV